MMSSVARVKVIKTKVIFRYHTKVSQTKFHQIRITKSKVTYVQILVPKWEKTKKQENIFWVTRRSNKGITNRGRFQGLQIGSALVISNWGKKITNRGWDLILGQRDFKSGQRLQVGARRISNRARDYKSVQNIGEPNQEKIQK